jgi:hypothetical protein
MLRSMEGERSLRFLVGLPGEIQVTIGRVPFLLHNLSSSSMDREADLHQRQRQQKRLLIPFPLFGDN